MTPAAYAQHLAKTDIISPGLQNPTTIHGVGTSLGAAHSLNYSKAQ
ncbi:hypothetical protein XFF6166_830005 [Xanthomonas citri pv. fuscans]|nr:hypothetical protein XFF6166_830005 [Xanthomonas citri pv. fuscans]SON98461.1 hypothetical protein XFF7767_1050003 [Xanthomonas citri pv. fuscans]SOO02883.1 hypothetical protein XFF6960_720002 [Xanthomonas citri pv. fuscans]SOO16980.1 hypothetical protein XFF7766_990002 [Xanthomonas citri pv. fuscans]SOO45493.1 hypothetical protein XFF1815_830002 [Xanthomonas citri pv. fuscans]